MGARICRCRRRVPAGERCPCRPASSAGRGYGGAWRTTAAAVIAGQPWCSRCHHPGSPANPLTADHIVPKAEGGTDDPSNLQTLCRRCNSSKRDR